jgi:alpha-L-fucosidase 2
MCVYPKGGNNQEGISLEKVWKYKVQNDNPPRFPHYNASYQPFADLWLTFPDSNSIIHYKRSLNLNDAICGTSYVMNGIQYKREYFASAPNQSIVIHLSANHKKSINFSAFLTSKHHLSRVRKIDNHTIAIDIKLKKGVLKGESRLRIQTKDGRIKIDSGIITVSHADEATLYLVAGTSFINYKNVSGNPATSCIQALNSLKGKSYTQVKAAHIRAYQKLFDTFSINLGHTKKENLPTDERIQQFDTVSDPSLVSLYMQYGRYLLIASSWPGTHPANLQGIWNDDMRPPWGSKYTTNINLEMNYWPAEVLNLSACHEPLFAMMINLAKSGYETAEDYYGCPGWVLHHNTDIWLGTAPVDNADHGIWPTGGAWLCHQLWRHFQFTQDTVFLRDTAYPIMKSAAKFFNCFLIKDPKTGWLISTPSNSPEHGGLVAGPTMDNQIIRDLFKNCISASEILQKDGSFRDTLEEKYKRIAPNQIGKYGQLQEWLQDIDDTSDHHRHVSHLWGVFPGTDITWATPKMMKAARQSLIYRGDAGTGWSLAWKINLWDRFKDGNHAFRLLKIMLSPANAPDRKSRGGSYPDLLDAHPPFQIDGNFGGATGIANMLVQTETGIIQLLPALPNALAAGNIKGICARGGFVLNFRWNKGELEQVQVVSKAAKKCTLTYRDKKISFNTRKGITYHLNGDLVMQ